MGSPITSLADEKEITLPREEFDLYQKNLRRYGPAQMIKIGDFSQENPTLEFLLTLRTKYEMMAVQPVEITPDGIFRYVLKPQTFNN